MSEERLSIHNPKVKKARAQTEKAIRASSSASRMKLVRFYEDAEVQHREAARLWKEAGSPALEKTHLDAASVERGLADALIREGKP